MSEPIFEASVRLRADVGDFEQQAQASVKNTLDRLEQQTTQAVTAAQQRAAQVPAAAQAAAAPLAPPPIPPRPPDDLTAAIERARALAAQPLEIDVIANTAPFDREVNIAFQRATQLAEQNLAQLEAAAEQAAAASGQASRALLEAKGFAAREQAQEAFSIAQQAERTATQAVADARRQLADIRDEAQGALLRPSEELQTMAGTAGTRAETARRVGDEGAQAAQQFQAEVLARQFALEQLQLQQAAFASELATATGVERDALLASAEQAAASAAILRREIAQLQQAGQLVPGGPGGPPIAGPEPPGGPRRSAFREIFAGREAGLAGLVGMTARLGVVGFAASAAFQAVGELQQSLRATGDEAFTTQGKLRNLGAELLGGNIIGGIKALQATKPATFIGGLDEAMQQLKLAGDDTVISLDKIVSLQRGGRATSGEPFESRAGQRYKEEVEGASDALEEFLTQQVEGGHINRAQAQQLAQIAQQYAKLEESSVDATRALNDYTVALQRAGTEQQKFGPEGGPLGRGPGTGLPGGTGVAAQGVQAGQGAVGAVTGFQRTGIQRPIITNPFENPLFQAPDPSVGARSRAARTALIKDEQERLEHERKDLLVIQRQARTAFEIAKEANKGGEHQREADLAFTEWREAVRNTAGKTAEIKAAAVAAAAEARSLDAQVRDSAAAAIADPAAQAQANLKNARITEAEEYRDYVNAVKESGRGSREANKQLAEYKIAVNQRVGIENSIAADAEAAAEAARNDARSAEEARLANNIAAAARTKGKADDKRFYNEAIDYYRQVARDTSRTATEREQARGQVAALREGLRQALAPTGDENAIQLQQLQNAMARAQQVGSLVLQRRAARRLIDFWEDQVRQTRGIERAQAQANLIGARGQAAAVEDAFTSLQEQRIQNRIQAARLTEGMGDDKKAADDLVRFWQAQVKNATTAQERVRAQSSLISAKLARQGLEDRQAQQGTTAFDLLTQFARKFEGGNLINTDQPFVGPSGFVADIAQFLHRQDGEVGPPKVPEPTTEFSMARLTEALEKNTSAVDRNTGAGKVTPPKVKPEKVTSRYADGRYYESARARANVETRGGF